MGADFYSKKINNPFFISRKDNKFFVATKQHNTKGYHHTESRPNTSTAYKVSDTKYDEKIPPRPARKKKLEKNKIYSSIDPDLKNKKKKKKKKKSTKKTHFKDSSLTFNGKISTNADIQIGLSKNECQGKTHSSFPTISRSPRRSLSNFRPEITNEPSLALQIWDTAGLERFVNKEGLAATFGQSFFRNANAAILVYDATSSLSFKQLIRWHSELVDYMADEWIHDKHESHKQTVPILIVGNKLDKLQEDTSFSNPNKFVPQRKVMGFRNDNFKGKDWQYEYTVSISPLNKYYAKRSLKDVKSGSKDVEGSLSYGLEGASWTADHSYLESIITAEDGIRPDRDMVMLWCRRNGLKHVEVSALDGYGIKQAIDHAISLGLKSINDTIMREDNIENCNNLGMSSRQNNSRLDFHARYKSDDKCNIFC
eukprot:CAMPEP_0184857798 /NCGR_PEP_ID=MMETSP0580-20130426/2943_1 /TAXON_ID=1118495 /ORGANISM="Dactyliosolen fragilissimus" /LENGTH=424 /DNA_ID=CAMNT_0027353607 /DNA_START=344 /DNA_END=1615 /DNA_ORIENTATION=+